MIEKMFASLHAITQTTLIFSGSVIVITISMTLKAFVQTSVTLNRSVKKMKLKHGDPGTSRNCALIEQIKNRCARFRKN